MADFGKFLTQTILIFPEYFQINFNTKRFQDPIFNTIFEILA